MFMPHNIAYRSPYVKGIHALIIPAGISLLISLLYGVLEFFKIGDRADGKALALIYSFICFVIIPYYIFHLKIMEEELCSVIYIFFVIMFQGIRIFFEKVRPINKYIDRLRVRIIIL